VSALKTRALIVEGVDDVAAVRGLLRKRGHELPLAGIQRNRYASTIDLIDFEVWTPGDAKKPPEERTPPGKGGLARRALDFAVDRRSKADLIGVCFDPDDVPEADEFAFFKTAFGELKEPNLGPLAEDLTFDLKGTALRILPAPWRTGAAPFYGLPDHHNLERVLLGGVLSVHGADALGMFGDETTRRLMTLVAGHGYKRAFRMWNAAAAPDAEGFVDRLLQLAKYKDACLAAIEATRVARVLDELLQS
jgi:hypothetical protein